MPIWSDAFLTQLSNDALDEINKDIQAIFQRTCLATTQGVSVITLPSFVRSVIRITYRGYGLTPLNWDELILLTPATVFVSPGNPNNIETTQSRPLYYAMHPTNPYDVRLHPCPNESLSSSGENPYAPAPNGPSCILSCYRSVDLTGSDATAQLPEYIVRRTQKAYVLWKAFGSEGPGQNLTASRYYKSKYDFLIERFRAINEGCYLGKRYLLDDTGLLLNDGYKYPKPILPPNFERIIYK